MSDPMNDEGVIDPKKVKRTRKPKPVAVKPVKSAKKPTPATPTTRARRSSPLPDTLLALIDNYVDSKTTAFNRVNKGRLTTAVEEARDLLIAEAIEQVDASFLDSNAGGLLD